MGQTSFSLQTRPHQQRRRHGFVASKRSLHERRPPLHVRAVGLRAPRVTHSCATCHVSIIRSFDVRGGSTEVRRRVYTWFIYTWVVHTVKIFWWQAARNRPLNEGGDKTQKKLKKKNKTFIELLLWGGAKWRGEVDATHASFWSLVRRRAMTLMMVTSLSNPRGSPACTGLSTTRQSSSASLVHFVRLKA